MGENPTATRVLDALVEAGMVTGEQMSHALESAEGEDVPVGAYLVDRGLVSSDDIATVLEEELGVPRVDISSYAPEDAALELVPSAVARRYRLLPLFDIEGMLTVAIGDPVDVFRLDEAGEVIGVEIEPVLADSAELLAAIVQYYGEADAEKEAKEAKPFAAPETTAQEPEEELEEELDALSLADSLSFAEDTFVTEDAGAEEPSSLPLEEAGKDEALYEDAPPPAPVAEAIPEEEVWEEPGLAEEYEEDQALELPSFDIEAPEAVDEPVATVAPAEPPSVAAAMSPIDLDVLAVADSKRVAILVADIVEQAVKAGASHIQVLPYKDDFFLVFRIKGALHNVASAPLSLQGALVEGLKSFAKLSAVPPSLPALGRVRSRYGERDLALTVSAVPTVAGQRVVVTLRPNDPEPPALESLGVTDAEQRALHAMVERGRGLLLLCAPVAGGRSATYYSLLRRAADSGRTVYSVESSIEFELPAVAQVMVNPGSAVRPSAYVAAGLQQDTDVIGIDSLQSVEDVHLAVEAAGRGRLVIATFVAGSIMGGVRRILDLGVEPNSLAAALTVGVGQRLARTVCPNCADEVASEWNAALGLPADLPSREGTGCPNCRKTGFGGVTGVFEVLPFTESVRAAVAQDEDLRALEGAAQAAGMRGLLRAGLSKVEDGTVSAQELARVLRIEA